MDLFLKSAAGEFEKSSTKAMPGTTLINLETEYGAQRKIRNINFNNDPSWFVVHFTLLGS